MPTKETAKRKSAPTVVAVDPFFDDRADLLNRLNKENPEFVYKYQKNDVSDYELQRKRQEIVKDENGEPLNHAGDPVVRMLREQDVVNKKASNDRAEQMVKTATRPDKKSYTAAPKEPIKKE